MERKPIKIYNQTELTYAEVGAVVQALNVENATKDLELGLIQIGEKGAYYRYAIQKKIRHNCITIWKHKEEN